MAHKIYRVEGFEMFSVDEAQSHGYTITTDPDTPTLIWGKGPRWAGFGMVLWSRKRIFLSATLLIGLSVVIERWRMQILIEIPG